MATKVARPTIRLKIMVMNQRLAMSSDRKEIAKDSSSALVTPRPSGYIALAMASAIASAR